MMNGTLDLTTFDYKTGQFCDKVPPLRARTKKVSIPQSQGDFCVRAVFLIYVFHLQTKSVTFIHQSKGNIVQ